MATTSMWDISVNTANAMYTWGSVIATSAAVIAAIAGVVAFWGSGVRDKHSDQQIEVARATAEQARESTANLEAETERLKRQNLELRLDLERQQRERLRLERALGPRQVTQEQRDTLVLILSAASHLRPRAALYVAHEAEPRFYARSLIEALTAAGVTVDLVDDVYLIAAGQNTGIVLTPGWGPGASQISFGFKCAAFPDMIIEPRSPHGVTHGLFDRMNSAALIQIFPKPPGIDAHRL